MSQQGGRPTGHEDDWWRELYDDSADDTGPAPARDSLDDRFASASGAVGDGAEERTGPSDRPVARPFGAEPVVPAPRTGADDVLDTPRPNGRAPQRAPWEPPSARPTGPVSFPTAAKPPGRAEQAPDPAPTAGRTGDAAPPVSGATRSGGAAAPPDSGGTRPGERSGGAAASPVSGGTPSGERTGSDATSSAAAPRPPSERPRQTPAPTIPASRTPPVPPPPTTPPAWPNPEAGPATALGPPGSPAPQAPATAPGGSAPYPPEPSGAASPADPGNAAYPTSADRPPAPPRPAAPPPPSATPTDQPPRLPRPSDSAPAPTGPADQVPVPPPPAEPPSAVPHPAAPQPVLTGPADTPPTPPTTNPPPDPPDQTGPRIERPAPTPRPRGHVGTRPPTYDAEPTALPAADPDDLDDLVADTVLDGARYGACTLRAVSVRGDSARYRGEPRRDSLLTARFGTGEHALLLVAMATGARAAPGAHRAAAEACHWIGRAVGRSHARLVEDIRDGRRGDLKSGLHRLTDRSLGKLRASASEQGVDPEAYAAGLRCLLLPADPDCRTRVFFGVGQGGLFRLREGEWQDIEPQVAETKGEPVLGFGSPPSETPEGDRLTMDLGIPTPPSPYEPAPEPPREPFRFRTSVARPGDTLLMCSGGLADPLRGEPELGEYLAERWSRPEPPGLAAFLADCQVRVKGYADDRTAAAVWEA
ncbi:protein phosphatase 2C domain-containing protein [Streptomyces sp. NPDC057424]|uniref:protein phosphatase 2C domain-containing protein n=1 Tax=Streptomyces sp. NPDC057424 TaxID=3346127 RepID=UPI00369E50F6